MDCQEWAQQRDYCGRVKNRHWIPLLANIWLLCAPGALLPEYSCSTWSDGSRRLGAVVNTGARSETAPYSGPVPGPKAAYCYAHLDPCHALIPRQAKATRAMAKLVCDNENHLSLPQRPACDLKSLGTITRQSCMYGTTWAVILLGKPGLNNTEEW